LAFASLYTVSFRNLADEKVNIRGKDIFLVGENGQGKTNFLEALYFCSYGSSFRGVRDAELITSGEKDCSVSVELEGSLYEEVRISCKAAKKIITLDGKKTDDRKELLSVAPCVVFCHEDMEFISGPPERRRWFFDQSQSLADVLYLDDLRRYRHILKSRNLLLKESRGKLNPETAMVLDALEPQMAQYGQRLMEKRMEAAEKFSEVFQPLYHEVSAIDGITIRYAPSWKEVDFDKICLQLAGNRERDISLGVSLSGPHRDRYIFLRHGMEFSSRASTGQRRLLALLLRIAQAKRYSDSTGHKPVLLLDDVLLELDSEKRRRFLEVMPGYDQAFYTFLPGEPYDQYRRPDTLVYQVENGRIHP
jgi:DNA replication and repair protein RecF